MTTLWGQGTAALEQSSHTAHLEEPEAYLRVVADFLGRLEEARSAS
jgi:pimeloyl-ACP methyl ester carboxylesterase